MIDPSFYNKVFEKFNTFSVCDVWATYVMDEPHNISYEIKLILPGLWI